MYRSFFGPDYYSFDYGGVHFMGLNTVDYDDLWYSGHVDSLQLRWIAADLAAAGRDARVVTFNHIPLYSALEALSGFTDDGPAPSTVRVDGKWYYRHTVRNAAEVLDLLGDRLEEALGGHIHRREFLRYETATGTRRFAQTAAVVGPISEPGPMGARSGITLYRVTDRRVDDGTFIPLDPAPVSATLRP
jgi:3',5'-cyclic AMP phosphodiesterase CpdA